MKNIVVIPNPKKDKELAVSQRLIQKLHSLGALIYVDKQYESDFFGLVTPYEVFPGEAELIIVVGGDGSVLDASLFAIENDVLMLGVNLGKVGYLSEVEPDNLDVLEKIISGEYEVEEKMLLSATHISGDKVTKSERLAVNDIIISHDSFLGIADFTLENGNGDFVKYRADGMILSTPVGSTAYNLSAGGPIISHNIDSIVATPICPHSFFNRSIVFKSTECLKLINHSETMLNISVDGRYFTSLKNGDECIVKKSDKMLKMLSFSENNMFATLFKKMRILEDIQ